MTVPTSPWRGDALGQIAEVETIIGHIAEHGLGLVELALALEIKGQIVEILHQGIVHRALAELVERHVELALSPGRQGQHAVRLGRIGFGFSLRAR